MSNKLYVYYFIFFFSSTFRSVIDFQVEAGQITPLENHLTFHQLAPNWFTNSTHFVKIAPLVVRVKSCLFFTCQLTPLNKKKVYEYIISRFANSPHLKNENLLNYFYWLWGGMTQFIRIFLFFISGVSWQDSIHQDYSIFHKWG